jgi:hypothetical protein
MIGPLIGAPWEDENGVLPTGEEFGESLAEGQGPTRRSE